MEGYQLDDPDPRDIMWRYFEYNPFQVSFLAREKVLNNPLALPLAVLGFLITASYILSASRFLYLHFLYRSKLKSYLSANPSSSSPPWALVTGASDGIGKALAAELLGAGFSIILHGRNSTKLQGVKENLRNEFPKSRGRIKIVICDASTSTHTTVAAMVDELAKKPITILINNVGGSPGYPAHRALADMSGSLTDGYLAMNVGFACNLTRELLSRTNGMTPKSLILNLSSAAAKLEIPYLGMYSGSKAFNSTWSRSLSWELRAEGRDVEVTSLIVGQVENKWAEDTYFGKPSARKFARAVLGKIGYGRTEITPYWVHDLQIASFRAVIPEAVEAMMMLIAAKQGKEYDRKYLESDKGKAEPWKD